jgi:L-iditol 2-dehydrogenase
MKALVLKEYKRLIVEDVPIGPLGAGDVRIRVRACGICGSDIHGYDGSTGRRRPPLVMGHEAAGEIAELAPDVAGYPSATGHLRLDDLLRPLRVLPSGPDQPV